MRGIEMLKRVGPAFIVGAVIIGPGSVTLMSKTGAFYGYSMLWVSLLAGAMMAGFIALFMRFGIYSDETFLQLTAKKLGRWYAALCGLALFCAGAAFQTGNSLGVTAAMNALFPPVPQMVWPIAFTLAAIIFMFSLKNIYHVVEKMMTVFLVGMFLAFLINLITARPDLVAAARGTCVPSIPEGVDWVTIGGLVATTCVIAAAFFQSYLVKAKGWTTHDLPSATFDTILASVIYTLIGSVIMMTAAVVLYDKVTEITFDSMVAQLSVAFGAKGKIIFALGFWAAAFSSFITNSLIAGLMLGDGVGLSGQLNSKTTRICATLALMIGMCTAVAVIHFQPDPKELPARVSPRPAESVSISAETTHAESVPTQTASSKRDIKVAAIAIGQASSLVAVPLGAIAMIVVLFDRQATKGRVLPIWAKAFVILGALVLLGVAATTLSKLWPQIQKLFSAA